ncbi:hypothetical protein AAFF_G00434280 [Aldrovandia affinis]|uniref:Uncharacterized protein n=1 Tax=Aldrovandia affinis TaxID=143900 RepID=A0AAD7WIX7_9TELE|nr:hypothetical protein AAFF_G00434280 [Aldrovandia affinis]
MPQSTSGPAEMGNNGRSHGRVTYSMSRPPRGGCAFAELRGPREPGNTDEREAGDAGQNPRNLVSNAARDAGPGRPRSGWQRRFGRHLRYSERIDSLGPPPIRTRTWANEPPRSIRAHGCGTRGLRGPSRR